MLCYTRRVAAALLLAAFAAQPAFGQLVPPAVVPATSGGPGCICFTGYQGNVAVPEASGGPANSCACCNASGPHCCNPYEDNNGPLLYGDPLLNMPGWARPGWFGAVEVDLVGTHIKNELVGQVTAGAATDTIQLPTAQLSWTVSPRIEVGYRFGEGAGELLLAYKFLVTSGTQTLANFDSADDPGELHSRLNLNAWDFDYASREISLWPSCEMKWRVGLRLAAVFFDSRATSSLLDQHEGNDFVGVGPHVGLDLCRCVHGTGLQLFGRLESASLVGETHQSFNEVITGPVAAAGASRSDATLVVPWLGVQAGLAWTAPGFEHLTLSAGYTFECWWNLADVAASTGDITSQGVFFRAELRY